MVVFHYKYFSLILFPTSSLIDGKLKMSDIRIFTPSTIKGGHRRYGERFCFLLQSEGITPRRTPKSFLVSKSQKSINHPSSQFPSRERANLTKIQVRFCEQTPLLRLSLKPEITLLTSTFVVKAWRD